MSRKPGRSAAGHNPFQETAAKNQTPRWSTTKGKAGQASIPPGLRPHPLVDAKLQDPPPGSEGREPITGDDSGGWEDEPAG